MWCSIVAAREMSRFFALSVTITVVSVASLCAQTPPEQPPCATKAALQREQVLQLIGNKKAPDEGIIGLIDGCHVNFSLDPVTIEQLASAGASKAVMDALDRDTLSRLSLAQARAEVAALENRKRTNEVPVNAERDAALRKTDADYAAQRKKIEEDEFKKSQQKSAELATLDRAHDAERSRISDRFATQLAEKNNLLDHRIGLLKQSLYAVADPGLKYIAYSADDSRLSATIGGEEFWFTIPPPRARTMYEQWSAVKVMQRYEDQESRERFLMEAANAEPVLGRSRAVIEKEAKDREIQRLLTSARQHLESRSYEQARDEYAKVKQLDPGNQDAENGLAAADRAIEDQKQQQTARQKQLDDILALRAEFARNPRRIPGTWYDASTNLLWTDKDNGKDITWEAANTHCQTLTFGGYTDWRLGTVNELKSLFDPSKTNNTGSFKKSLGALNPLASKEAAQGFPYHIKGDIQLGQPGIWTSEKQGAKATAFVFVAGQPAPFDTKSIAVRALCTHRVEIPIVSAGLPPTPSTTIDKPGALVPGGVGSGLPSIANTGAKQVNSTDGLAYVRIPAGTFTMGCSPGDVGCQIDERPTHQVQITKAFWMGQTEVTVGAWKRYRAATGAAALPTADTFGRRNLNEASGDDEIAAVGMTWDEAKRFCEWSGGRLPTEAEWEYAARAGSTQARYANLDQIAWYLTNSGRNPRRVGQKQANAWGVYDMLGNVWEWVGDWYGRYPASAVADPVGPPNGQQRTLRGGAWGTPATDVRVSRRQGEVPESSGSNFGMRCAAD